MSHATRAIPEPVEPYASRFWSKVDKSGDCWIWTSTISNGYGCMNIGGMRPKGAQFMAHRISYTWTVGPIPEGMLLDHLCRNTLCVNPAHLEVVTHIENTMRGFSPFAIKARQLRCKRGHEFTPENTTIRKNGTRWCKECARMRDRQYTAKRRASSIRNRRG